jgi:hypothetical protein
VIGGDAVAEKGEHSGADDVLQGRDIQVQSLEEGRVLNVGRVVVPLVEGNITLRERERLPELVTFEYFRVSRLIHLWLQRFPNRVANFFLRRPDVAKKNRFAAGADA